MKSIKGTKTEINLLTAFAGEAQARNRYTYFASVAKKEGYVEISKIFEETADQEKEHAKRLFKFLEGGDVQITESFPAGKICSTLENLKASVMGETHEFDQMYPDYAKIAKDEGFHDIADVFSKIAVAEKGHAQRYQHFANLITNNTVFKRPQNITWRCLNCGYMHNGSEALEKCPACNHPRDYFEVFKEYK